MKVVSVNVGQKKVLNYKGRTVETGFYKFSVKEIYIDTEGVVNDTVIDRRYHGGIDQAVYAYSESHYAYWKELYPKLDWEYGMFGENLTILNLEETEIYIGDIYKVGEALLEVTKPREPCLKLGIRFGTQKVLKQFWNSTKSGVYFKVIQGGVVTVNDKLILSSRKENSPTIAMVYEAKKGLQK